MSLAKDTKAAKGNRNQIFNRRINLHHEDTIGLKGSDKSKEQDYF